MTPATIHAFLTEAWTHGRKPTHVAHALHCHPDDIKTFYWAAWTNTPTARIAATQVTTKLAQRTNK